MGFDELLVDDVNPWRRNHAGNHVLRLVKEVAVVDVAVTREGHDQSRFAAATRSAAALSVVGGRWRHVAHMHDRQVLDVHP